MKYIAAFDIGTTAVKGVLCSEDGVLLDSGSVDISTIFSGENAEYKEQDPAEWYSAFCRISGGFFKSGKVTPAEIEAVVMSGQMQDVIPIDKDLNPVGNAILYSDGRGEPQSDAVKKALGEDYLEKSTGNHYDGSLSFPKLMWIKENQPERFQKIDKVLISSKDYVIAKLTGNVCGDVTACATAGAMDIHKKVWDETIIRCGGISPALFPQLLHSHQKAGSVHESGAQESGYLAGTPVYAGVGDAGATTLASGISDLGQYNINLGTSGWVATLSDDVLPATMGVFNLAAMPEDKYINVVPFLNAGNVHKWISSVLSGHGMADGGAGGETVIDYEAVNRLLAASVPGSSGLMFLPYLAGERFPVMDAEIRGCFLGVSPETRREDMARACLEGVAFSIRQGIESIGVPPQKVSVIGGGGRVAVWCQILADVLNQTVDVYENAEILPSLAISAAALLGEGKLSGYDEFTDSLQSEDRRVAYRPVPEHAALYDEIYPRYLRIYPAVRPIFEP